jgi:predicted CXXCH cytochrome family protein
VRGYLLLSLFVLWGIWAVGTTYAPRALAVELPCLQCHKSKGAGKVVHPAVGMGCGLCHVAPHAEEKPALSLSADVPGLCFQCHDKGGFENSSVHSPVAAGMCTACHNPHSSENEKLLSAKVPDLCFGCHDKSAFTKKTRHSPAAEGQCLFCHSPHASANAYNLQYPPGELCLMCHPDKSSGAHVLAGLGFGDRHPVGGVPDPSRKGRELSCTSCHNPHSSDQRSLFPEGAAKRENLCLMCHERSYIGS